MLINALAYGTIVPLLYPYAQHYGINPTGLSFLFASFSLAQFIATPILGRLSDKFGRKPVLLLCLLGTSISLALFASATSVAMLFFARIVDGITGGNISVAQAVIADSTKGHERAKSFALLGAAFGFGFLVGPALGAVMSNISLSAPFWFGSVLALVGTILGIFILKETLPPSKRQPSNQPIFHFKSLVLALFAPLTGIVLVVGLFCSIAQNAFIIGLQSFSNDVLRMTPTEVGLMFAGFGLLNILTQAFGVRILLNKVHSKSLIIIVSSLLAGLSLLLVSQMHSVLLFVLVTLSFGLFLSPIVPIVTGLLSERTKGEDQGIILGINQSYTSIGQIVGPLLAGFFAGRFSISSIFILAAGFLFLGGVAGNWLGASHQKKFDF